MKKYNIKNYYKDREEITKYVNRLNMEDDPNSKLSLLYWNYDKLFNEIIGLGYLGEEDYDKLYEDMLEVSIKRQGFDHVVLPGERKDSDRRMKLNSIGNKLILLGKDYCQSYVDSVKNTLEFVEKEYDKYINKFLDEINGIRTEIKIIKNVDDLLIAARSFIANQTENSVRGYSNKYQNYSTVEKVIKLFPYMAIKIYENSKDIEEFLTTRWELFYMHEGNEETKDWILEQKSLLVNEDKENKEKASTELILDLLKRTKGKWVIPENLPTLFETWMNSHDNPLTDEKRIEIEEVAYIEDGIQFSVNCFYSKTLRETYRIWFGPKSSHKLNIIIPLKDLV